MLFRSVLAPVMPARMAPDLPSCFTALLIVSGAFTDLSVEVDGLLIERPWPAGAGISKGVIAVEMVRTCIPQILYDKEADFNRDAIVHSADLKRHTCAGSVVIDKCLASSPWSFWAPFNTGNTAGKKTGTLVEGAPSENGTTKRSESVVNEIGRAHV